MLTGWFAGPRTRTAAAHDEAALIALGLQSLANAFGLSPTQLRGDLTVARAVNWGEDPFARGAYSYATPTSRAAQERLARIDGPVCFSGEALYHGRDMGTVEAALAAGAETAQAILAAA